MTNPELPLLSFDPSLCRKVFQITAGICVLLSCAAIVAYLVRGEDADRCFVHILYDNQFPALPVVIFSIIVTAMMVYNAIRFERLADKTYALVDLWPKVMRYYPFNLLFVVVSLGWIFGSAQPMLLFFGSCP